VADLEIDEKRAKAIEAMVEMANDAKAAGQDDMAKGFFQEAARLMEAHAENAEPGEIRAQRTRRAQDFRIAAQGGPAPTSAPAPAAGGPAASGGGGWQVTWTQAGDAGAPVSAPDGSWEPFAIAHSGGGVVVGWRRRA
jgi:hypothetical protein